MTDLSQQAREGFAPCPTCRQYSHSIPDDKLGEAFRHFEGMIAHPVRGHPMGYAFDQKTRDMAQVLAAAAQQRAEGRNEALNEAAGVANGWPHHPAAIEIRRRIQELKTSP